MKGFVATAVLLALALAPAAGFAQAPRHPLLAVNPLTDLAEVESYAEAVARWYSRGVDGAALLLVGVNSGMRPLGTSQSAAVAGLLRAKAAGDPAPGAADVAGRLSPLEAGFVRAAVALGIVREVYWLTPFDYFRGPGYESPLPADMRRAGFAEEDLRTFVMRDGCFRGTVAGTPLAVCGIDAPPQIADAVLLSVDAEYVLSAAATAKTNPVAEIQRLLQTLAGSRYSVREAVVIPSVEHGRVPPELRWIGETIGEALRDPSLLARPDPPKRWSLLQLISVQFGKGAYTDMLHKLWPFLTIHDEDPALHLFAAGGLAGLARGAEALERAEQACRLDPGYCFGLPWIGLRLFADGDIEGGERFFAAGARLRPGMTYGQLERGLFLLSAGRRTEALGAFTALIDGGAALPGGFLAGMLLLESGDPPAALRRFDLAFAALEDEPDFEILDPETAQAVQEAARLYREQGLPRQAERLERVPGLMPRDGIPPPSP